MKEEGICLKASLHNAEDLICNDIINSDGDLLIWNIVFICIWEIWAFSLWLFGLGIIFSSPKMTKKCIDTFKRYGCCISSEYDIHMEEEDDEENDNHNDEDNNNNNNEDNDNNENGIIQEIEMN